MFKKYYTQFTCKPFTWIMCYSVFWSVKGLQITSITYDHPCRLKLSTKLVVYLIMKNDSYYLFTPQLYLMQNFPPKKETHA